MINPKSWSEVSINQYIQLYNLKDEEDADKLIKELSLLTGKKSKEIEDLSMPEYIDLSSEFGFYKQEPNQLLNLNEPFLIGNEYFYFNKNLNSLSLGEYVDLEMFNKDMINNLHNIAGVLFRREGEVGYNKNNADLFFDNMNIEIALSGLLFFYLFANSYLPSDTENCSLLDRILMGLKDMKKKCQKELKHLKKVKTKKGKSKKQNSSGSI